MNGAIVIVIRRVSRNGVSDGAGGDVVDIRSGARDVERMEPGCCCYRESISFSSHQSERRAVHAINLKCELAARSCNGEISGLQSHDSKRKAERAAAGFENRASPEVFQKSHNQIQDLRF